MLLIWIYPDSVALALDGMLLIQTVYLIYESRVAARRTVAFISRADDRLCLSGKVEVSGSKCAAVCFSLNETRRYVSEDGGGWLREWRLN